MLKYSLLVLCIGACLAQDYDEYRPEPKSLGGASRFQFQQQESKATTEAPVAILKQINRHNEDGSYTYGYEAADGSFKIETKAANGEVKGKYGYFDGERVRVVEYGADRFGFQPSGEGITVPPPTFVEENFEEEQPQRPIISQKPKYAKQQQPQYRPQPAQPNYAPVPIVEKRKPEFVPQQQYYDYEEEVIATTPKPVQPPRPKFQQPSYSAAPVPPRPQFANAVPLNDVSYADAKPSKSFNQQPQFETSFESRQPAQFPQQQNSVPVQYNSNRPADFPLFTPANSRADVYKPKAQKPPAPRPQFTEAFAPEQSYEQPQYSHQPAPQPQRPLFAAQKPSPSRNPSILDQLAKDFALPQGSTALHDISFGYSLQ